MPAWLLVFVMFLAVHRLTRLAIADEIPILKVPRDAAVNWLDPETPGAVAPWGRAGRSIAYLLGCPWCMSIWVGGVVVWLTAHYVGLPAPWLVWLAASTATGLIANVEAEHDQHYELNNLELARGQAEAVRR